jgi:hypothetical protein
MMTHGVAEGEDTSLTNVLSPDSPPVVVKRKVMHAKVKATEIC